MRGPKSRPCSEHPETEPSKRSSSGLVSRSSTVMTTCIVETRRELHEPTGDQVTRVILGTADSVSDLDSTLLDTGGRYVGLGSS